MLPSAPSGSRSNSSIGLRVMASREAVRWSRVRGLSRSVAENCSTTSPNPWLGAISTRHSAGSEFRTTCAATVQPSECAITPAAGPNCWPAASSASMSSMTVPRRRPMKPGSESPWLGAFVEPLVATGHRLVAVDAPSHGDSDPGFMGRRRGTVMELMEALDAAGQQFGPAAGVIAHSLGCTVAAQVVRNSLPAECLVLIAPNHGFGEVVEQFSATLRLNPRTRDHLTEPVVGRDQHQTLRGQRVPHHLCGHGAAQRVCDHPGGGTELLAGRVQCLHELHDGPPPPAHEAGV